MLSFDTLIIGAGISGLYLGRTLKSQGKSYMILEKSRGVGGRMATRRVEEMGLDHGSTYLQYDSFLIDLILDLNLNVSLRTHFEGLFFLGGMSVLVKKMAEGLALTKEAKAEKILHEMGWWVVETEDGRKFKAKNLVLTAPVPQSVELLQRSFLDYQYKDELDKIKYSKALIGIFVCDKYEESNLLLPEVHSLIAMKDRDLHPQGYILRLNPLQSEKAFDDTDAKNLSDLVDYFYRSFKSPPRITHQELKKWRYAKPLGVLTQPYLEVSNSLYLIGDAFSYPDVRGSLKSALNLSRILN